MGVYAIFTRRGRDGKRKMHAVKPDAHATVCGLPVGVGTGLVRDGDYRANVPCAVCWDRTATGIGG